MNTVIFDLDGTLVDSARGIRASAQETFDELAITQFSGGDIPIGPPIAGTFRDMFNDKPSEFSDHILSTYRKLYRAGGLLEADVYDGIPELLLRLKEKGLRLFLATAKLTEFAQILLDAKKLSQYFEGIYGGGTRGEYEDKHDLLEHIIKIKNIDRVNCTIVGDRKFDIRAGLRSNISTLGVLWGYGSRAELVEAGAHKLARVPGEIVYDNPKL